MSQIITSSHRSSVGMELSNVQHHGGCNVHLVLLVATSHTVPRYVQFFNRFSCLQTPLLAPSCSGFYSVNPGCFFATSHDLLAAMRHWNLLGWSLIHNADGQMTHKSNTDGDKGSPGAAKADQRSTKNRRGVLPLRSLPHPISNTA